MTLPVIGLAPAGSPLLLAFVPRNLLLRWAIAVPVVVFVCMLAQVGANLLPGVLLSCARLRGVSLRFVPTSACYVPSQAAYRDQNLAGDILAAVVTEQRFRYRQAS